MAEITIDQLTEVSLTGNGVFDVLMRAVVSHLDVEFNKNRVKGPEYSQVYLGSIQAVLEKALTFLLQKQNADLQAQLLEAQIAVQEATRDRIAQEILKVQAEVALVNAQAANIPKEGALLDAQAAKTLQEKENLEAQALNIPKEGVLLDAQAAKVTQETQNLVVEKTVLVAQECKLRAEYDVLLEQKLKSVQETALLAQKKVTEQAQTQGAGVDLDSIIGRQKKIYEEQAKSFIRDAEQKTAKAMIEAWIIQRSTGGSDVLANTTIKLSDTFIGQAVSKMLQGVGLTP